jgi:hypothetical protein
MTHAPLPGGDWRTTSFGDSVRTSPRDLADLVDHLSLCQTLRGRWFGLRCGAEAMSGFVVARFVTTLVLLAWLAGLGWWAW